MKKYVIMTVSILLAVLIAAFSAVQFFADTIFTDKGFSYTQMSGNYVSVCDWEGGSDSLVIPLKLNNSYVRNIANFCFSYREDFTSIDFYEADYLDYIGVMSFKETAITGEVSIPSQVKSIGMAAFQGCTGIDTLYYHSTANVPDQCFYLCDGLKNVVLDDGVSTIGNLAFASCDSLEFVRIPETVTSISETAFDECPDVVIYCYTNSYAHQYAVEYEIAYVLIDAPDPPIPT